MGSARCGQQLNKRRQNTSSSLANQNGSHIYSSYCNGLLKIIEFRRVLSFGQTRKLSQYRFDYNNGLPGWVLLLERGYGPLKAAEYFFTLLPPAIPDGVFEIFEENGIASASISQVHKAKLWPKDGKPEKESDGLRSKFESQMLASRWNGILALIVWSCGCSSRHLTPLFISLSVSRLPFSP